MPGTLVQALPVGPALLERPRLACRSPTAPDAETGLPSTYCLTDGTACGEYGACLHTVHLIDLQTSSTTGPAPRWTRGGRTR